MRGTIRTALLTVASALLLMFYIYVILVVF